jgi:hypothetical protein
MSEAIIPAASLANVGGAAYLEVSDLRTPDERYPSLHVKETEVSDAVLATMILDASALLDRLTGDHFLPTTGSIVVDGPKVDGFGRSRRILFLPRRVRAVSDVSILATDGTTTSALDVTAYRVHSSLISPSTTDTPVMFADHAYDGIELLYGPSTDSLTLPGTWASWGALPSYPRAVVVTGQFDWAAAPEPIKQATAWLVLDWCRQRQAPARTQSYSSGRASFEINREGLTGIDQVDRVIAMYKRAAMALSGV